MPEEEAKLDVTLDAKPYEPPKRDRSLLGFYIGLGVVAILVALGAWVAPATQLSFHSWCYRTGRDPEGRSLAWVARYAASQHLDTTRIKRLLGAPGFECRSWLMYDVKPGANTLLQAYMIFLQDGKAQSVEPRVLAECG